MRIKLSAIKNDQILYFSNAIKKRMSLKLAGEKCYYHCFDTVYIKELNEYKTFICPLTEANNLNRKTNNCWHTFDTKEKVIERFLEYFTEAELFEELGDISILKEVLKHGLITAIRYPKRQCMLSCNCCGIIEECTLFRSTFALGTPYFIAYRRKKNIERYISLFGAEDLFDIFL